MIKTRKIRSNKTLNQKVNKQAGKKKRGSGGNEFLPACQSAEAKRRRTETLGGIIQNPLADFVQRKF